VKLWIAAAAAVFCLSQTSLVAADTFQIHLDTPPPGFVNTYLVTGLDGPIESVHAFAKYEWWWNIPLLGPDGDFSGEFTAYSMDWDFNAYCEGPYCASGLNELYGRGVTVAMGENYPNSGYIVRVSNRFTQPNFNVCADVGDEVFPCALYFEQPRFYLSGDRGTGIGASVQLLQSTAVPEPATWATMIVGFGLTGAAIRRRRSAATQPGLC